MFIYLCIAVALEWALLFHITLWQAELIVEALFDRRIVGCPTMRELPADRIRLSGGAFFIY